MIASLIITAYNQINSILAILDNLNFQTFDHTQFEVILIDDGSTDGLFKSISRNSYMYNLVVYRQENGGRSSARNTGVKMSNSDIIIFCDGDRYPSPTFIEEHVASQLKNYDIVIGNSYDYFGDKEELCKKQIDFNMIKKRSRMPSYLQRITQIYDTNGETESTISWLSFLVGNSSVKRKVLYSAGLFDEKIKQWGFEHFDLAYRFQCQNRIFYYNPRAENFHLPHSREKGFYLSHIQEACNQISIKYPKINANVLQEFISTSKSIEEITSIIYTNIKEAIHNEKI